jgi:succinate dehydrogenase / fumarate reductase, membrane anchor subunit
MVTSVTSLGRNGLYDWLVQRVSAVVLLCWFLFLAGFVVSHGDLTFADWQALFSQTWMRIFTLGAMLSLVAHAWIGMWTISTDYFTTTVLGGKATTVRLLFQLACLLVLVVYLVWCVQILWSI